MDDKDFTARVLEVVKNNAFAFKKILLGLDDCVPKTALDEANSSLVAAKTKISELEGTLDNANRNVANLNHQLDDKNRQFDELKNYSQHLRDELARCRQSLSDAKSQIDSLEDDLDDKTARLANYTELERAYNLYRALPANIKFDLEGVFGAESTPTTFLSGALQDGHLESLFDYTATVMNSGANPNETETLSALLNFAFDAVNSGCRDKVFARLNTRTGDDFDRDTMRKTSASNQSGTVKSVLLAGFKYIRTDKIVRPSLVVIA